jgi:hypothetical protein
MGDPVMRVEMRRTTMTAVALVLALAAACGKPPVAPSTEPPSLDVTS